MKSTFFHLFLCLAALLVHVPALSAQTAPVSAVYYQADPDAKQGFREIFRWRFNANDDWRRFAHFAPQMPVSTDEKVNPFKTSPTDMIALSVKDANGVTGQDYFLSENGIMISLVTAEHQFYQDTHRMNAFLKEELLNHKGFEKFPGEKYPPGRQGIIARYNINLDLPNPSWLINQQKDVNLYDSFLRDIKPLSRLRRENFEAPGHFILLLNYPNAPGRFATIGPQGIRLSRSYSEDRFFKDESNYYQYFRAMALEHKSIAEDVKKEEHKSLENSQF